MSVEAQLEERSQEEVTSQAFGFLGVDRFIDTLVGARALKTAFELGLVDHLLTDGASGFDALARRLDTEPAGLRFLVDLLCASGVLTQDARKQLRLTRDFRAALAWRDLLETKLDFAGFAMNDFADHFTAMVRRPAQSPKGRLFDLFDYRRCFNTDVDSYRRTRAWMRLTSTLTRYEAGACLTLHDFGRYARMLDVGGNSGEFALQLCRRHAKLEVTVFDLPLVCEIGQEHVLGEPEHPRIGFVKADVRHDAMPQGHDLVTFKSMLHDWPEDEARRFIAKAVQALDAGGTLAIFERGPIDAAQAARSFSMLPVMQFFGSYREPQVYVAILGLLGMQEVSVQTVQLDTPFFLVTARKPAA
ncbi:MAG TPA: methyltransferase [Burkholderiaceae bacterium]|nr:methyltransferase [Burkholderiaceae bacterium]